MSRSGKSDPRALDKELEDESRVNGVQKRKQKKKGKKGGRAYEDEDDLDAVIEGLDGPTPSAGITVADADEAMDLSAAKKKNNKKKGGVKKGAFDLLDEEASDSEVNQAVPSLDEDEAEEGGSLMFAGKKKGKKGKKDKKPSLDDYPVLDPDAEAEPEEAIDLPGAKSNNKKKGGAMKGAFGLLDEDTFDGEDASVSPAVPPLDEMEKDEAEEEETLMFAGKKKGKKGKKDKKPSTDDYPEFDPEAEAEAEAEAEEALDFSSAKKKNNKKGGAKKAAFSLLDEDMSDNEVASVSPVVPPLDEAGKDEAEEEETLMFGGKKKGKKGKKDKKPSTDDYPEFDPEAEAEAEAEAEEALDFSSAKKKNNKKKGGAKKAAFNLLDEDMSDSEVASVNPVVPFLDEAGRDESEEEETLMFAGKKKGKKGKKDSKASKDDEGIDALIGVPEEHKLTEAAAPVAVLAEPKGKQKKKGKKSGRTTQEEEDLDAILAELEGPRKSAPPASEAVILASVPIAAEEPVAAEKSLSAEAVLPDEEVTESAASKKKKKKKEKEKAAKAGAADKPEETIVEEKKVPVKGEDTRTKVVDKKVPKHVREMQERLARMKEAEEKKIQEEEEKRRKEEEEQQRLEELERQKEEAKRRRKEREKEKLLQKKKEGKLLTGKKKEEARRLAIMREQFGISTDLDSPTGEDVSTPRKPKYETKKKRKPPGAGQAAEAAPVVAEEAEMLEPPVPEPEPEVQPEPEPEPEPEPVPEPAAPVEVEEEEEEEDWDAKSFEEVNLPAIKSAFAEEEADDGPVKAGQVTVPPPSAPALTRTSSPKKKPAPPARSQHKVVENENDDDEDDEDEDEDDEDDDSEENDVDMKKIQQAKLSREKRREEALKKRSAEDLRSPICCILGHVDTGKTKLLDCIRRTNVQEGEAGGITQQIGATYFPMENIKERTKELKADAKLRVPGLLVIDTPGHESFTNLRARGSSLCDIAILVIDIMHGLEPQTIESLNLLKARRTPFVIALNKVDRLYGWKACPNAPIRNAFKLQSKDVIGEFEQRLAQICTQLKEQGLNSEVYYKNKELRKVISIIPTSAISGEGVPDILMLLVQLTQKLMEDKLMYISEVQATVLEVKVVEGLGTTIDVVLVNGVLHEGDQIVVCGMQGPILTNIRALLTPHPMKELRVKGSYQHHKELKAAQGIKITAQGLEHAIAGTQLYVVGPEDDVDDIKEEAMQDIKNVFSRVDKSGEGVCVQASTLGSLEALLEFLKSPAVKIPVSVINIGPVHKKDVMRASVMLERKRKEFATILAFDVKVTTEAKELAEEVGVRIFTADIIYHLFDQFTAYMNSVKEEKRKDASEEAVFPCVMKIMPQCVFNKKDPIIVGVEILDGVAKVGTPLCVPSRDGIDIGKIASMEINHKVVDTAKKGQTVAMKVVGTNAEENARMFGRHFDMEDEFVSRISRRSIDLLKENYRDDLTTDEWRLVVKLKKLFEIP